MQRSGGRHEHDRQFRLGSVADVARVPMTVRSPRREQQRRRPRRPRRTLVSISLLVMLLVGCGGQVTAPPQRTTDASTATPSTLAQVGATGTAVAAATANEQDVLAFETAQASSPMQTPSPTPASISTPTPTLAPSVAATPSAAATSTAYVANFSKWPTRVPEGPDPTRVSFDAAAGQYTIALTDATQPYVHWEYAPEGHAFANFTLDVDASQVAGPPHGTYGVLFRAQPQSTGDQTNANYYLGIDPGAQELFLIWTGPDNKGQVLARTTLTAIQQGKGVNHLHVQATGDKIAVVVNGVAVGTATGPSTAPGAVGLIVVNPQHPTGASGETATFRNLVVTPLP
jgi:hypothetical protein